MSIKTKTHQSRTGLRKEGYFLQDTVKILKISLYGVRYSLQTHAAIQTGQRIQRKAQVQICPRRQVLTSVLEKQMPRCS